SPEWRGPPAGPGAAASRAGPPAAPSGRRRSAAAVPRTSSRAGSPRGRRAPAPRAGRASIWGNAAARGPNGRRRLRFRRPAAKLRASREGPHMRILGRIALGLLAVALGLAAVVVVRTLTYEAP